MKTRQCNKCKEVKAITEFNKRTKGVDGHSSYCRDCHKAYLRENYKATRKARVAYSVRRKRDLAIWLEEYKATLACEHCGRNHPGVLDFHHEKGDKEFAVGKAVTQGYSKDRILEEIAKCKVLCCLCHRMVHWCEKKGVEMADFCPGCGNDFGECTCGRKKADTPENVKEICLYAWLGEDEHGSGVVGIKQALVPAGCIPLVAKDDFKIDREYIQQALQAQADTYGKTIRLCKFVFVEELVTLEPKQGVMS